MSLSNPLNVFLLGPIFYLVWKIVFPELPVSPKELPSTYSEDEYNWLPAKHPEVLCHQKFTPAQLSEYDGVKSERILLAVMKVGRDGKLSKERERTVFDVSAGRGFYGPDGMYGNFAGRDASRGLAKHSFDEDMLTAISDPLDTLDDLSTSEIDNMKGWHETFEGKYIVCGELVEPEL
ncbi:hypothetical protein P7C73_g3968, partial [Tremellales sp. Uapishka_1]